jgi:hypothetical protein
MSDPVRLIHRSGLASALLRAGSEERPSSARLRRALSTVGAAAAVSSIASEAVGGGAGAIASGALGSAIAKAGAGSVVVLAAKWMGIGSLGALVAIGATEIGSRVRDPAPPRVAGVVPLTNERAAAATAFSPINAREVTETPTGDTAASTAVAQAAPLLPRPSVQAFGAAPTVHSPIGSVVPSTEPAPPTRLPHRAYDGALEPVASSIALTPAPAEGAQLGARSPSPLPAQLRLAKEVSLVDRAWAAMKRRDFSRALAELADYERNFPELGLHPEVLFVRMEAEERLGRVAAAKLEASRILASYPKSAQANRARALLSRP